MSEGDSSETNHIMSVHEVDDNKRTKARILTQEEVDEQIRNYITPLIKKLKDLTPLIQEYPLLNSQIFLQGQVLVLVLAQLVPRPAVKNELLNHK